MTVTARTDFWDDKPSLRDEALSVPQGWQSMKSFSFQSPDRSVTLTSTQRSGTASRPVAELGSLHATEITAAGGEVIEPASSAIALAGRKVTIQTFVVTHPDAGRMRLRAAYHVTTDVETIVTSMASVDSDEAMSQADDILRTYDPSGSARSAAATRSLSIAQDGTLDRGGATMVGRFSRDELIAAARLLGIAALPTIVDRVGPGADGALAGLIARDVVSSDAAGGLVLDPSLERSLRTLVAPSILVSIESGPPGRTRRAVVHVDETTLVSVRPLDHGVLQIDSDARDQLQDHLRRGLALRNAEAVDAGPATVDGEALALARAGNPPDDVAIRVLAFGGHIIRVRSLVSVPGRVTGGELTVVDGGHDGYWLVESSDGEALVPVFSCRPISSDQITEAVVSLTRPTGEE